MSNENNKKECFIANFDGNVYLIPMELRDLFDSVYYESRHKEFEKYLVPDEVIFENITVDNTDFDYLMDGGYE